ncbi:MAG TPA: flagellar export chaperone FliS [Terriglobia bacterium]|nr:flagellar export chaperone FliS [Terriglobia bacterium]
MSSHSAGNVYRQVEVCGSNRVQLVVMLYDGAIRFLRDASIAAEKNDVRRRGFAVNRALAILGELQSTLNFEEGAEIAQSLDRLYTYLTGSILDANLKGESDGFAEAIRLLQVLNSAWTEVSTKSGGSPAPAAPSVSEAAATHSGCGAMEFFG